MLANRVGATVRDERQGHPWQRLRGLAARDAVAVSVACARARRKIENESFNVRKSNGRHLERDFGHGRQNLAMMFAAMNPLAFAIHAACDCLERARIGARTARRARKRPFEHVGTLAACLVFPNWQTLTQALTDAKPPPDIAAQAAL